ncbi:MAG: assimilatory sulfite reductase (NADPH) flavoprotein subunit [Ferrimonas sp.]
MLLKEIEAGATLLAPEQMQTLRTLVAELSPIQAAWLSGYLAAVANQPQSNQTSPKTEAATAAALQLTILYGSQTGNSRQLAEQVAATAEQQGRAVQLHSMHTFKTKQLAQTQQLLLIVSTHGEGDPPDEAIAFHKYLFSKRVPQLPELQYSVLALGDSSYEHFCQTGKELDQRLTALGATAICPRVDCDVDFENDASHWCQTVLAALPSVPDKAASVVSLVPTDAPPQPTQAAVAESQVRYDKNTPYTAELLTNQKITGRHSNKDIRHIELDLADSGLQYHAGDALGVWLPNDPALVTEITTLLGWADDAELTAQLRDQFELTLLNPATVKAWAAHANQPALNALINEPPALRDFIVNHQLVELLQQFPITPDTLSKAAFTALLRPLTPRLYSIASAQEEVGDEVHLTVAEVAHERAGTVRLGAVSGALARRLQAGDPIQVYVSPNNHFRLPPDDNTPIIMIGPGTGIAPFRAFMQARDARGARGENWLFFGNPTFTDDFLYQTEWQAYVEQGLLSRIDLAFSRDQAHKIYVQDRMWEQGATLFEWLQRGAHLYLCGDAKRMAKDVEQCLLKIIVEHGQLTPEEAQDYLDTLRQTQRYQKDVY